MKHDSGNMSANPNRLSNYRKSHRAPVEIVNPRHPANPNQPMDPDDRSSPSNPDNRYYPLNPKSPVNAIRDPGASMPGYRSDRSVTETAKSGSGASGDLRGMA